MRPAWTLGLMAFVGAVGGPAARAEDNPRTILKRAHERYAQLKSYSVSGRFELALDAGNGVVGTMQAASSGRRARMRLDGKLRQDDRDAGAVRLLWLDDGRDTYRVIEAVGEGQREVMVAPSEPGTGEAALLPTLKQVNTARLTLKSPATLDGVPVHVIAVYPRKDDDAPLVTYFIDPGTYAVRQVGWGADDETGLPVATFRVRREERNPKLPRGLFRYRGAPGAPKPARAAKGESGGAVAGLLGLVR